VPLTTLIADTRKAVADDAGHAQAVFSAHGTLVGVTEVDIRTGTHTFKADEPPALGGADMAANPVQYALASLGSCQAITYRFWAEQLGISFDSLTVRAEGDLDIRGFLGFDYTVRPGLSAVRVQVPVSGPESAGRYQELAPAVGEHCPVLDLFRNPVPVSRTLLSASGSLSVPGRYHTRPCLASSRMADQRVHPPIVVSWRPPRPLRTTHASAPGGMPG
jgi:uncharacterized OsmC-like protein